MIISRRVALAKIESPQGTDANPVAATDAIRVENPVLAWLDPRFHQPESVKPSMGSEQALFGGALRQLTFELDLKGSGAAGTPPEAAALLRACGLGQTIVASTSVAYAPVSSGHDSVTLYLYEDGRFSKLLGALGTMALTCEVGKPPRAAFTFTGHSVDPADAALPSPTLSAVVPPVFLGSAFSVDGFAAKISTLSLDLANELSMPEDVAALDGWSDIAQVGRAVAGSINPLDTLVATYDWDAKWKANTLVNLTTGAIGGTAGNIITITCPKAQYREVPQGDREKIQSREIAFDCRENTGDDEISIVLT